MAEAKKKLTKKQAEELKTAEKEAVAKTSEKISEILETEAIAEAIVEAEHEIEAEEAAANEATLPSDVKIPASKVAKAGKRSAKAIAEVEEKQAKEERKADTSEEKQVVKAVPKARTRLERQGKKMRAAAALVEKGKEYGIKEALEVATKTSTTKFDSTVELHVNLGVDPRHADQNIRQTLVLPAGTGKNVKVAVFAEADDAAKAKKAGADIAGSEEFLAQLDKGVIDFDVLIATPAVMPKLGKYARVLGPKGLMPSPKSGTVTTDVEKAVAEAKAGKVEFRVDTTGIVHLGVGKVSFGADKLAQNVNAVLAAIKAAKPASVKGVYLKSIYITTTMGPSLKIANSEINV